MNKSRVYFLMAASMTLMLLVSGFSLSAPQAPIKIGVVHPLSGTIAMEGHECLRGAQFAAKLFNDAGGLDGRKAEIVAADSKGTPVESVNAAEKLITSDKVVALCGAFTSGATRAIFPILERHGILMTNNVSSDQTLTNPGHPWFFRTKVGNDHRSMFFGKFIAVNLNAKSVAMLAVNDDFGRTAVASHKDVFLQHGVKIPIIEYFEHGEMNFQAVMTKIKNSGADALFLVAEVQDGAMIMRQYYETGLKMPVVTVGSLATPEFFKLAGRNAEGIYTAECYADGIDNPVNLEFVEAWKKQYKYEPGNYALSGYMEAKAILEAIKLSKSDNPTKIRDAMRKVSYDSPIGHVSFDENGQAHTNLYITLNKNGKAIMIAEWDSVNLVSTLRNK